MKVVWLITWSPCVMTFSKKTEDEDRLLITSDKSNITSRFATAVGLIRPCHIAKKKKFGFIRMKVLDGTTTILHLQLPTTGQKGLLTLHLWSLDGKIRREGSDGTISPGRFHRRQLSWLPCFPGSHSRQVFFLLCVFQMFSILPMIFIFPSFSALLVSNWVAEILVPLWHSSCSRIFSIFPCCLRCEWFWQGSIVGRRSVLELWISSAFCEKFMFLSARVNVTLGCYRPWFLTDAIFIFSILEYYFSRDT